MQNSNDTNRRQVEWERSKKKLEDAQSPAVADLARLISNSTGFSWLTWTDDRRPHVQWMEAFFKAAYNILANL